MSEEDSKRSAAHAGGASVCLVLAILSPSLAHGGHHDAVHIQPRLTHGRGVGLAQIALQHVEERLPHHLREIQTNTSHCGWVGVGGGAQKSVARILFVVQQTTVG